MRCDRLCPVLILSFNRYMVECECLKMQNYLLLHLVLIDTWWNVNIIEGKMRENGIKF